MVTWVFFCIAEATSRTSEQESSPDHSKSCSVDTKGKCILLRCKPTITFLIKVKDILSHSDIVIPCAISLKPGRNWFDASIKKRVKIQPLCNGFLSTVRNWRAKSRGYRTGMRLLVTAAPTSPAFQCQPAKQSPLITIWLQWPYIKHTASTKYILHHCT